MNETLKSAGIFGFALLVLVTLAVPAAALTAGFTTTPDDPYAGEEVEFDASATTDAGSNATYDWDFDGDGTVDASGQVVTHTFASAGDHEVELTVNDPDAGTTDTVTQTVSVREPNSLDVTASLSTAGTASSMAVAVDGTDQAHDLSADGDFSTTLTEGSVVTFTHSDGTSTDYTIGDAGGDVTVSDATVSITEETADTSGGGSTTDGGSTIPNWLIQSAVGAVVVAFVFRILPIDRNGRDS